ncbi:MAG: hypothetical protein N3E45_13890 [Oscillatoriaceae bacterium SKW80]|nr:hypothetical protein [Oscillatoriaceae bacterium SKYG93]MCX8121891.1 hypothetical protein [Oscillatoriaceae bacterium SKW80]MDW8454652.1 hypothetical protein [Oscillatoriaceae cyanobacterium SKYGB_i_bin93]
MTEMTDLTSNSAYLIDDLDKPDGGLLTKIMLNPKITSKTQLS